MKSINLELIKCDDCGRFVPKHYEPCPGCEVKAATREAYRISADVCLVRGDLESEKVIRSLLDDKP